MISLSDVGGPYEIAESITPSDTTRFTHAYDALIVGDEGAVTIQPVQGAPVTITIAVAPVLIPIRVVRVHNTGTDCLLITGVRSGHWRSPNEKGQKYVVGETTD